MQCHNTSLAAGHLALLLDHVVHEMLVSQTEH